MQNDHETNDTIINEHETNDNNFTYSNVQYIAILSLIVSQIQRTETIHTFSFICISDKTVIYCIKKLQMVLLLQEPVSYICINILIATISYRISSIRCLSQI